MNRRPRQQAFTLVELLVVIGIIALLISILLPALNRAREQANNAVCQSNLKQIATAIILYANENNGRLLPSCVEPTSNTPQSTIYGKGLFWSNHLIQTKYLSAPVGLVGAFPKCDSSSVFRCPSGLDEPTKMSGFSALSPRDGQNRQYVFVNYPSSAETTATWYALNSVTCEAGTVANVREGGSVDCPFVWFNHDDVDSYIRDPRLSRNISRIRRAAQVVMMFDGNTYNWNNVPGSTGVSARMSGRHGKATNGDKDGMMNVAFFDGHVGSLSTEPYTVNGPNVSVLSKFPNEAIFFMHDAK